MREGEDAEGRKINDEQEDGGKKDDEDDGGWGRGRKMAIGGKKRRRWSMMRKGVKKYDEAGGNSDNEHDGMEEIERGGWEGRKRSRKMGGQTFWIASSR